MSVSQARTAVIAEGERVVPMKMAHLVFRCADRKAMVDWYRKLFQAELVFEDEILTFITYDDEHHRLAFFNMPHLPPKADEVTGVHHIAYSYAHIDDLLRTYLRLKEEGIRPYWCINHGPTTSLYFRDPEGNDIELQVDNFSEAADAAAFFHSETFANDPIGLEFDPDAMVDLWLAGASETELCRLGTAGTGTRTLLG
ncbi:VOC family protein [Pseudomonas sp. NPDC089996]|uniref:VOC family protein n=1 Tax=Pseudomonas sp. NPDC089996 TaxID=3364474 RepID=UPI00382CD7B4